MWIYTQNGFISVVQNIDAKPGRELLVRSRMRTHLVGLLGQVMDKSMVEELVLETPANDYPFRAFVSRELLTALVVRQLGSIDYPNFKGRCLGTLGHKQEMVLMDVWEASRRFHEIPDSVMSPNGQQKEEHERKENAHQQQFK